MKVITTVDDIKAEANRDNRSVFILQLNKKIVEWLYTIGGKNRNIIQNNLSSWRDCIKNGEWCVDNCEMKMNESCTWLIDGHHRVLAVDLERAYGLLVKMSIVPDELQDTVFRNQDCRGSRRNISAVATLYGINDARFWIAIEKNYRSSFNGDRVLSTVDSVTKFIESRKDVIDKVDTRRKFQGEKTIVPAPALSCLIRIAEKMPNRIDDLNAIWNRVITGEMLNSRMPEYHIRSRIRQFKTTPAKTFVWYIIKGITLALDGCETSLLKVGDVDIKELSVRYSITSNKSKIGSASMSNSTEIKSKINKMSKR